MNDRLQIVVAMSPGSFRLRDRGLAGALLSDRVRGARPRCGSPLGVPFTLKLVSPAPRLDNADTYSKVLANINY